MYHNNLTLYLAIIDNYFVYYRNLRLVTQVVHFLNLLISFFCFKVKFVIYIFYSTKYARIFLMDELIGVSMCLDSVLIGSLLVFWLIRLMMVEET